MSLARHRSDVDPDAVLASLEADGATIVEGLVAPDRVDGLVEDFAPHLDAVDWCNSDDDLGQDFFGRRTKRLHGLLARSKRFGELLVDPLLVAVRDRVLGPLCRETRLSTGELMALGPGQPAQMLHRDADSWHRFPQPRPEILFSANVALTDFTSSNGATVVVPGSHRWDPEREPRPEECDAALMPRGSALLYSGNVLHGGGANQTDGVRIGLYFGYILSWLRPIEHHLITNGEAVVRAAPPDVQRLLDYTETGWTPLA